MPVYRITGIGAAINGLPCLKEFSIRLNTADTVAACSASNGAVIRSAGNNDWQGVALGYGLPPKWPGDYFQFIGNDRGNQGWTSGSEDTRGVNYGAIVEKVHIFNHSEQSKNVYYHLYFAGNGSLTSGAAAAIDGSTPRPLNPKGSLFKIDGTTINGVLGWEMEIDGNCTDPSWPSNYNGWPARDPGNIDIMLRWKQQFDATNQLPTLNSFCNFKPYHGASINYDISYMQIVSVPANYPVEGKGGKAEYVEMPEGVAKFSGYYNGAKGFIRIPTSSTDNTPIAKW